MDIQALIDSMNDISRDIRKCYHVTLEKAIEVVSGVNHNCDVIVDVGGSLNAPHSYRGYYSDLSFAPTGEKITAGEFLKMLKDSLGKTFGGYKGGDFVMDEDTPLWFSPYGCTGRAIIALSVDKGTVLVHTKEVD